MPKLRIESLERDLEVKAGQDVRQACRKHHVSVFWSVWARLFNCRGIGLCGACPVRVLEVDGPLPGRTKQETRRLEGKPEDWRLACQLPVKGDLRIELYPMVSVEDRVGEEAVRRARLDEAEREELVKREHRERLEARRAEVGEFLAARKKRRSKLVKFLMKRLKKGEPGEKKGKKKKASTGGRPEKKGKALGDRLKRDGKDKKKGKGDDQEKKGARAKKKERGGGEGGKKAAFKLGKRGKKKEAPAEPKGKGGG